MSESPSTTDACASRTARADRYFKEHLSDQRGWYGRKSGSYKRWAQHLSFLILAASGLTALVQTIAVTEYQMAVRILTASLALVVALAEGAKRIGRFDEIWLSYRKASEMMKREYRLYINAAGPYGDADEEAAYRLFVLDVEQVIAEEQQLFFRAGNGKTAAEATAGNKDG
jgi:hypothetical protein